jgi:hypothetical protein
MVFSFSLPSFNIRIPLLNRVWTNAVNQPVSQTARAATGSQDVYSPQAAIAQLQGHIEQGLQLIREGEYKESMDHFQNQSFLQKLRIKLIYGRTQALEAIPTSQHGIQKALSKVHDKNWYHTSGSIELAQLVFIKKGQPVFPKTPQEQMALRQLQHEQALMYAEEHIHALQALKKQNITFAPNKLVAHADEIDIATTLASYNVPLTEAFLRRYNRLNYILDYRRADYSAGS